MVSEIFSSKWYSWCVAMIACAICMSPCVAAEKPKSATAKRCEVDASLLEPGERAEWQGACVEGKPGGKGMLTWSDKSRKSRMYDGEMVLGLPQGDGVMHFANDMRYVGQFVDGKLHGKGSYHLPGGDRYEGGAAGVMQGPATYYYANGDRYVGSLVANGYGTYYLLSGDRYEGNFAQGSLSSGAVYHYTNGNRYEGQLLRIRSKSSGALYLAKWQSHRRQYAFSLCREER